MNKPAIIHDAEPREARFTVPQFIAIAESGALDAFVKSELLDGRIIVVNAQAVWHMRARMALVRALEDAIASSGGSLEVGSEGSIMLTEDRMPQPDVFLWEPTGGETWIHGSSVRLIIEVASSSDHYDLGEKRRLYAGAGIPEYWVAVERAGRFERFANPIDGDYADHDQVSFQAGCASLTLPSIAIPPSTIRA